MTAPTATSFLLEGATGDWQWRLQSACVHLVQSSEPASNFSINGLAQQSADYQAGSKCFSLACRLDLAAEHGSTVKWEKVCPASAGSLHQATISETEGSLSEPSAESSTQLSPRTTAQDNK